MTKYEKYVDDNGVYAYEVTLEDGDIFKAVPKELGDYLHKLEQKLLKLNLVS